MKACARVLLLTAFCTAGCSSVAFARNQSSLREKVRAAAPFAISDADQPAFTRRLLKNGKIELSYGQRQCRGAGTWRVRGPRLVLSETTECLQDSEKESPYAPKKSTRTTLKITAPRGELRIEGEAKDSAGEFSLPTRP